MKGYTKAEKASFNLMFDVAEEICQAQERAKMSDRTLAKRSGISVARLNDIKSAMFDMTLAELLAIGRALDARVDLFMVDADTDEWKVKRAIQTIKLKEKTK